MNIDPKLKKEGVSLQQTQQIRQLFNGLRIVAFILLLAGILLAFILPLFMVSRVSTFIFLLFYGVISAFFLIARVKSVLMQMNGKKLDEKEKNSE